MVHELASCTRCTKRKIACKDYGWKPSTRALSRQTSNVQTPSRAQEAMSNDQPSTYHSRRSGDESGSSDRSGDNVPHDPSSSTSSSWAVRTDAGRVQDSSFNNSGVANSTANTMPTAYDPFFCTNSTFSIGPYANVPDGGYQGNMYTETVDYVGAQYLPGIMQYQSEGMQVYQDRTAHSSAQLKPNR